MPGHTYDQKTLVCASCEKSVTLQTCKLNHPEAPELFSLPSDVWIGMVVHEGRLIVACVCSRECLDKVAIGT
jgi:hypothetical protein